MKIKFCDIGQHETTVLFHARTKDRPSCCPKCLRREPIKRATINDNTKGEVSIHKEKKVAVKAPIKLISDKQKERLRKFRKKRDAYMKDHPICEYPGCNNPSTELHHGAGKIGDLLFDDRYFKALDSSHHRWVEEHPKEAQELGLSFKRLDKWKTP